MLSCGHVCRDEMYLSRAQIGKIQEIFQAPGPKKDDVRLRVLWYYRPEEALGGRKSFHGDKELFESDHSDEIHKDTIIGKCFVHSLRKYEVRGVTQGGCVVLSSSACLCTKIPPSAPHQALSQITESDFFTRFMYKPAKKEFEPDQVPVFCVCEQPYNPDKYMVMCEQCTDW